jgi:hypothetical protein
LKQKISLFEHFIQNFFLKSPITANSKVGIFEKFSLIFCIFEQKIVAFAKN